MGKIGKSFSRLLGFSIFMAWFVFVIWGMKTWEFADPFVSPRTTIILLSIPILIGMFILFIISSIIGAIPGKKKKKEKEEEKKFSFTTKDGDKFEFKGDDFDIDKIPAPFREIGKKFMEMAKKEMEKEK
jgi:hypothetical protein